MYVYSAWLLASMAAKGVKYKDLEALLGRKNSYITARMAGRMPFTMDDVHILQQALAIPWEEVGEYFPPSQAIHPTEE